MTAPESRETPASPAHPRRVAYLTSRYPLVSHTFIEREVAGLRRLGVEVHTFTARRTGPDGILGEAMRAEDRATVALVDRTPRVVLALLRDVMADVGAALSMAWLALRTGERRAGSRATQLLYLAEAYRLHAEMRARGLRHVHVHFANNGADVARLTVALGRRLDGEDAGWRWSFTMHGPTEFESVDHFDLAAKVVSASAVACISDFTRSQLMKLVPATEWPKLGVVRMSVDLDAVDTVLDREHDGALRVLYVGRLVPEKGSPVLLEALEALASRGVEVEARLVGAGPLQDELAAEIVRRGLGRSVSLTGALDQDGVRAQYAWADVFCLPSFQEGLPVVLMEAMASGLPVVTTRIAGIPELVDDGEVGRVLAPGRADELAEALAELASDQALRHRWGAMGPERVRARHDLAVTARQQLDFLSSSEQPLPRPADGA